MGHGLLVSQSGRSQLVSALTAAAGDLGERAARVRCVIADVTSWQPDRVYEGWHDRAVFHFLVDPRARGAYVDTAMRALAPDGRLVIGCFASDGPSECSGLPIARHDADDLATIFSELRLRESFRHEHHTPWGATQMFTWAVFTH